MNEKIKNITVTMIFEGGALNRDENIGGNITSIKKLRRKDGTYSFISRNALRHYLFQTLHGGFNWRRTTTRISKAEQKNVIQFNLHENDIFSSPELDIFGYMHTEKGQPSIIRKGPLGISKAIALEQYSGDMAFYANHDLVARTREEGHSEDPNPFSKEEHQAFYKATFTIDSKMIGKDEWFIPNQPEYDEVEEFLSLKLSAKKNAETKKISCAKQDETTFINRQNGSKNKIEISPVSEDGDGTWSVKFSLDKKEKSQRILQILKALKSGLYSKSSGETNPIVPLFFMAAPVRVPVPVLHPHLDIVRERESWRVIGVKDGIQNDWIEGDVYLSHSEKLPPAGDLPEKGLTHSWDGFICSVGLSSGE